MFNSELKAEINKLKSELAERDKIIDKYQPLFNHYDTYESICEAIDKKSQEEIELSKQIEDIKQEMVQLENITANNVYDGDQLYESYFGDLTKRDYDHQIENFKHIISCENDNIKFDISQGKGANYHFQHDGVDDINYNQPLEQCDKIILYNAVTYLISLCMHLKCDCLAHEVTATNIDKILNKVYKFRKFLENMFKVLHIKVNDNIFIYDVAKLTAISEIEKIKVEKKEERRRQAEIVKEQEALEKELDEKEKKLKKALDDANEEECKNIKHELTKIAERRKNTRAGWVYVIDCDDMIANCYKVGITRRLDWTKRIDELSDASHSFRFNVRGIVWSEDVFKLEANMHKYLSKYRLNQVNYHKEHFICSLDEIEEGFKSFGYDVQLNRNAINYDYIESVKILEENGIKLLTN